jgi:hypothetical protein
MSPTVDMPEAPARKRRYLVHLFCGHDECTNACRYIAVIQLWAARISAHAETQKRVFNDEYELIEVINPLLPRGSDVRDVLSHIEGPEGFIYLLHLDLEEAAQLGWRM